MMSVGIMAAGGLKQLVTMVDWELPAGDVYVWMQRDGRVRVNNPGTTYIPGVWYDGGSGSIITIGDLYQARRTLQSGSAQVAGGGSLGTWRNIGAGVGVEMFSFQSGRVLIEIRDQATGTILASGRVWRGAEHAP